MKLKEYRSKDTAELAKMLTDAKSGLSKITLEHAMRKDKNVKKLSAVRREIATLSGMISARVVKEAK